MRQPFRYSRGEFNGHYLKTLSACPNYAVQDVLDEMTYQRLVQWKLEDAVDHGEMFIKDEDIVNIARIAGVIQSYAYSKSNLGSVMYTQSHIVNGKERSERGLLNMQTGLFEFVRTDRDEYQDDVANRASKNLRMGMVPDGAEPVGYLPYGAQLYAPEGEVIWENLLPEPPDDGTPYTPFYGEKFLTFEEYFNRETLFAIDVFKTLFECMQRIRYNGPTITSFMEITQIIGDGYIRDIEITPQGSYYVVFYKLDAESEVLNKERRFTAWQDVCAKKFKLFVLEERM